MRISTALALQLHKKKIRHLYCHGCQDPMTLEKKTDRAPLGNCTSPIFHNPDTSTPARPSTSFSHSSGLLGDIQGPVPCQAWDKVAGYCSLSLMRVVSLVAMTHTIRGEETCVPTGGCSRYSYKNTTQGGNGGGK